MRDINPTDLHLEQMNDEEPMSEETMNDNYHNKTNILLDNDNENTLDQEYLQQNIKMSKKVKFIYTGNINLKTSSTSQPKLYLNNKEQLRVTSSNNSTLKNILASIQSFQKENSITCATINSSKPIY